MKALGKNKALVATAEVSNTELTRLLLLKHQKDREEAEIAAEEKAQKQAFADA